MSDDKNTPMGGNVPEEKVGKAEELTPRNCWAIDTLVEEVTALFDTEVETSEPNRFNANKVVTFMPTVQDREDLYPVLISTAEVDERIASVVVDDADETIRITIVPNSILMDSRDSFGIDSAYLGLDRELTSDDLTPLAADLAAGDEGFTEASL